jgi:hypothetical protein
MFRSLFQDHLQGSSFALSAYHSSAAHFVICLYCICGRMHSVCICIQCICLCAVWSFHNGCILLVIYPKSYYDARIHEY